MKEIFKNTTHIGFDLDGTLYPYTAEIQNRVKDEIAKKVLDKKPELNSIDNARKFLEEKYKELESTTKIMAYLGYENPSKAMDECLAKADILDLLKKDKVLEKIIKELAQAYTLYLITGSPEDLTIKKLEKIGINPDYFKLKVYSDTPGAGLKFDGDAFNFIIKKSNAPPSCHVYIGDRPNTDILPSKKLGMKTIAVGDIKEADIQIKEIHEIKGLFIPSSQS